MFCKNCGKEIPEGTNFCPSCGTNVGETNNTFNQYNATYQNTSSSTSALDAKVTGIVAYISWIGWIIAYCLGDKEKAKFHLNQALVLHLFALLSGIPYVGWAWGAFCTVCMILGIISAANMEEKELPIFGSIHILK